MLCGESWQGANIVIQIVFIIQQLYRIYFLNHIFDKLLSDCLRTGLVSGWGRLVSNGPTSTLLRVAEVTVLDPQSCLQVQSSFIFIIPSSSFLLLSFLSSLQCLF